MVPVCAAPAFNGPGQMRAPQKCRRNGSEELVVLPVMQLDEEVQAPDGTRRRHATGVELALETGQSRRLQIGPFEAADHVREHVEVPGRPFGRVQSLLHGPSQRNRKHDFGCHDDEAAAEITRHERIHGGRDGHRRESCRNAALPSTSEDGGAFRPPDERVAVYDRAEVRPGERQRFA